MTKELLWLMSTVDPDRTDVGALYLDRIMVRRLMASHGQSSRKDKPQSAWAHRLCFAHTTRSRTSSSLRRWC